MILFIWPPFQFQSSLIPLFHQTEDLLCSRVHIFPYEKNPTASYDWSDPDARCRFRWYHNNTVIVRQWTVHKRAEARSPVHMKTSAPTTRDPPIWYILLAMKPALIPRTVVRSHCETLRSEPTNSLGQRLWEYSWMYTSLVQYRIRKYFHTSITIPSFLSSSVTNSLSKWFFLNFKQVHVCQCYDHLIKTGACSFLDWRLKYMLQPNKITGYYSWEVFEFLNFQNVFWLIRKLERIFWMTYTNKFKKGPYCHNREARLIINKTIRFLVFILIFY